MPVLCEAGASPTTLKVTFRNLVDKQQRHGAGRSIWYSVP